MRNWKDYDWESGRPVTGEVEILMNRELEGLCIGYFYDLSVLKWDTYERESVMSINGQVGGLGMGKWGI